MQIGEKIPDLRALNQDNSEIILNDVKESILLYFYPKDNTSGCTTEGQEFAALHQEFLNAGLRVFGVSKDNVASHKKFCDKYTFPFDLLADIDGKICETFDVWKEKSMYGRKYMGIMRYSFLIDENKVVTNIWTKVKPKTHAQEVLDYFQSSK